MGKARCSANDVCRRRQGVEPSRAGRAMGGAARGTSPPLLQLLQPSPPASPMLPPGQGLSDCALAGRWPVSDKTRRPSPKPTPCLRLGQSPGKPSTAGGRSSPPRPCARLALARLAARPASGGQRGQRVCADWPQQLAWSRRRSRGAAAARRAAPPRRAATWPGKSARRFTPPQLTPPRSPGQCASTRGARRYSLPLRPQERRQAQSRRPCAGRLGCAVAPRLDARAVA